jgi:zinc transport system substrate-binding protein
MTLALLLAALAWGFAQGPARAQETLGETSGEPLDVFVSVLPLQGFTERIGGERVRVHTMVQPGQSPATYEPTPRQIAALADADLYLRVGVPFEGAWMKRIASANADMPVVDLRDGIDLRPQEAHNHGDHGTHEEHGHTDGGQEAMDAHVWTSPRLVRRMAETIRDALTELDPEGADIYRRNQAAFDAELAALDAELAERLAGLTRRSFLVYHPAWGYFAEAYGLTQVPIEQEGKAPGARRLAALIDQARANDARLILVQPQFDQRAAEQVARAIDGRVEAVDPLSSDLAGNLRRLAELIAGTPEATQ